MLKFFLLLLLPILAVSCKHEATIGSDVKIDSGVFITQNSKNTVPGVVAIDGCTATIVSTNTLVTAAHCLGPQEICVRSGAKSGLCSSTILKPREHNTSPNAQEIPYDVAVVIYPANSFEYYFNVAKQEPQVGDELQFVGYSEANASRQELANGSKRWGTNIVSANTLDRRKTIQSISNNTQSGVAVSPGDSGGPAFKQCELVGVASRMTTRGRKTSMHTNIVGDSINLAFLKSTEGRGAYFCGLSGNDPQFCPSAGLTTSVSNSINEFPCDMKAPGSAEDDNVDDITAPEAKVAIGTVKEGKAVLYFSVDKISDNAKFCTIEGEAETCAADDLIEVEYFKATENRKIYKTKQPFLLSTPKKFLLNSFKKNDTKVISKLKFELSAR